MNPIRDNPSKIRLNFIKMPSQKLKVVLVLNGNVIVSYL